MMRATILGLSVLVAASPALAQSKQDKEKARALYETGLKHYNLAEYPEAIKAWKESYSLTKKPLLLFNIGQAYRLSGDCKLATTFYDNYQREEPNPKNQDELDQAIALCAKPDKPKTEPPVAKPIDTPAERPVNKPLGTDKSGPTVGQVGDGTGPVDQPEPAATTTGGGMRTIGYGVAGAGVVLGIVGIVFARQSAAIASDIEGTTGEWDDDDKALESKGQSRAKLAWITGGAGVAALIAGGVMIAIGGPKAIETTSVSLVPTRGGAAVGWGFRF